jgi:hypothetical protein
MIRPDIVNTLINKNVTDLEKDNMLLTVDEEDIREALYILEYESKGRNATRIDLLKKELRAREKPEKGIVNNEWTRWFTKEWKTMRKTFKRTKEGMA